MRMPIQPHRLLPLALIALGALSLGSGCPTIPKVENRVVELALGGTTTMEFESKGPGTHYDSQGQANLATDIDLAKLLDDAGIDASDVKDVKLAGVSYRVSVPNAGVTISNGTVTVQRQGDPSAVTLVNNFSQDVGSATPFITAPLNAAGVTVLNTLLGDMLTAVKNGTSIANPQVTYHVIGDSNTSSFDIFWQMKIDVTIVGTVKVKVLS